LKSYSDKLINSADAFTRESFEKRMVQYGFKNIERMEKFLWDLELFLQIQSILGNRIVLKGGAAVQFYLPVLEQRTSVDIDMIFYGNIDEIEETLYSITEKFKNTDGLFQFRKHTPRNPKTCLPLYTYYVDVPSVLTAKERRSKDEAEVSSQEVKVEFVLQDNIIEFVKAKGIEIFAVKSDYEYQVLPINSLFADKLTTLGPETIGVQDERMDEQIKQFYDIWMLTKYHFCKFKINEINEKYVKRAKKECENRVRDYDLDEIKADVKRQLYRFSFADSGEDTELKRRINDFNSLYLNSKVDFNPQIVACGASLVRLVYETILEGESWDDVKKALEIEKLLELEGYSGKEKGEKARELREMLIREFGSYSTMRLNILKGKKHTRIFWSVVDKENVSRIKKLVENTLGHMNVNQQT